MDQVTKVAKQRVLLRCWHHILLLGFLYCWHMLFHLFCAQSAFWRVITLPLFFLSLCLRSLSRLAVSASQSFYRIILSLSWRIVWDEGFGIIRYVIVCCRWSEKVERAHLLMVNLDDGIRMQDRRTFIAQSQ
jgi:hypothetical protein